MIHRNKMFLNITLRISVLRSSTIAFSVIGHFAHLYASLQQRFKNYFHSANGRKRKTNKFTSLFFTLKPKH